MRIDPGHSGAAAFLFAHQDDEFGVFRSIERERAQGARVEVAYLTTGVPAGGSPQIRNNESMHVLASLGVTAANIEFAGASIGIADGDLAHRLPEAVDWLSRWLRSIPDLARIYVPAWEGGHPDHDCLHAAVLIALSSEAGLSLSMVRQYPLYNAYRRRGPFFRVLFPLPQNGNVEPVPIPWVARGRFIWKCLQYPSQAKSWMGLFPFAALHYLLIGKESLQQVSLKRLIERPHDGPLYYERRQFSTWAKVSTAVDNCRRLYSGSSARPASR
jgi:LmbE family N-acetylglucosaminyl deacetylase